MEFRRALAVKKMKEPIRHRQPILLMGSCFSEHIGEKLRAGKFRVLENPHGILFNPVSIATAIRAYIEKRVYTADELFELNETWHSWDHHSRFSAPDPQAALQKINDAVNEAHSFLQQTEWVIITLGSAFSYELAENNQPVANCHKAPANIFRRKLLSVEDVLAAMDNTIHRLRFFNPAIKVIFTISPVRHLREGMVENNRSKAVLIQAVHHLVDKFEGLYYFPAYELVIDDLRDYRFYAEDMVHPNYQATGYVWEKLAESCFDEDTISLLEELRKTDLAYRHRPFNPETTQHKKFLQDQLTRTAALQKKYDYLDLSRELLYFAQGS